MKWVIVLLILLIFAVTSPRKLEDFGVKAPYYRVDNYFLFSTCSASLSNGKKWDVYYIGVLGMAIKTKPKNYY